MPMAEVESDGCGLEWYVNTSRARGVTPRCPFASVHRCPRFYASVSLLGAAGNTPIEPSLDARLLTQWRESDLWPATREQDTAVMGTSENPRHFTGFCPEVAYDNFRVFASSLHQYVDEPDAAAAGRRLAASKAPPDDWRWRWQLVTRMHFTECPLYAPLLGGVSASGTKRRIGF